MSMYQNSGLNGDLIDEIIETINSNYRVKRIVLFGSRATGKHNERSDIDLAIESDDDTTGIEELLNEQVETLLKIDVLKLNEAEEKILKEVEGEGIVIYEKT